MARRAGPPVIAARRGRGDTLRCKVTLRVRLVDYVPNEVRCARSAIDQEFRAMPHAGNACSTANRTYSESWGIAVKTIKLLDDG
jgi:hypothetical protein